MRTLAQGHSDRGDWLRACRTAGSGDEEVQIKMIMRF